MVAIHIHYGLKKWIQITVIFRLAVGTSGPPHHFVIWEGQSVSAIEENVGIKNYKNVRKK